MHTRIKNVVTFAVPAILVTGAWLHAGPLNPPAGPIAPTNKTLAEVEPRIAINATNTPPTSVGTYTIRQPGSYYLTENLIAVGGFNAIGISLDTPGAVTIDLGGFEVVGNGGSGSASGITALFGQPIVSVTIRNGTIRGWAGDGIDLSAPSCTFIDLRVRNNGATGITSGPGCTFFNCIADDNGTAGIATGSGCVLTNCIALSNNTDGFLLGSGNTISGCTAYLNSEDGISASIGCDISNCTSYVNAGDGIEVQLACSVRANTCDRNGFGGDGGGIHATGSDNRIDGNSCTNADRGIDVDVASNIIIKNTCAGNTVNWDIAANNVVGPILDRTAPASAAILGNSAPDSTGSTHPNANFTY